MVKLLKKLNIKTIFVNRPKNISITSFFQLMDLRANKTTDNKASHQNNSTCHLPAQETHRHSNQKEL